MLRKPQSQDGHAEGLASPGLVDAGYVNKLVSSKSELVPKMAEVFVDQPQWKFIISGRDRRMGREGVGGVDFRHRIFKGVSSRNHLASSFQGHKGRMAFVHVPDIGVISQQAQGAHSAN